MSNKADTIKFNRLRLADFLENLLPEQFDMNEWYCGSVGCIGGWGCRLFQISTGFTSIQEDIALRKILGLSEDDANRLFYPEPEVCNYDALTAKGAARVLRHFSETGEIVWDLAFLPELPAEPIEELEYA